MRPKANVRTYDRKWDDINDVCILLYAASSVAYMVIGVSLFSRRFQGKNSLISDSASMNAKISVRRSSYSATGRSARDKLNHE